MKHVVIQGPQYGTKLKSTMAGHGDEEAEPSNAVAGDGEYGEAVPGSSRRRVRRPKKRRNGEKIPKLK